MIRRQSRAYHTVMTGCAVTDYIIVIKYTSGEDARSVANATIFGGGHMVLRLTNSVSAVMAGFTGFANYASDGVVESISPGKRTSVVAHTAISGYYGMGWRFTRCIRSVMAGGAFNCDGAVVENNGQKIICDMTMVAVDVSC